MRVCNIDAITHQRRDERVHRRATIAEIFVQVLGPGFEFLIRQDGRLVKDYLSETKNVGRSDDTHLNRPERHVGSV